MDDFRDIFDNTILKLMYLITLSRFQVKQLKKTMIRLGEKKVLVTKLI